VCSLVPKYDSSLLMLNHTVLNLDSDYITLWINGSLDLAHHWYSEQNIS